MNRLGNLLARLAVSGPTTRKLIFGLIVILCAIGNLPWHLDNYDQAKQAYVSYEIAHGGSWWYQHTPRGDTATKPPLAGWISAGLASLSGNWDLAWRLPGFLCTLILLWLLAREGQRLWPEGGALLAGCAFGLNLLTPRIATLVRTDMMLTLWITLCGWLIYRQIRAGGAWTPRGKWAFFGVMTAALFTKGPILYAFILPGMAAWLILAPKPMRRLIWSGWWTWAAPLALFLAWGVVALVTNPAFYQDVVVTELFSRFDQSLKAHEKQQPIWFYFPHLIHKFLPWSLLALALPIFSQNVRRAFREKPELLWLACWALGGLLCMTFIPSKRVDRIFPVVPPLCLLLVGMVAACQCGQRIRAWCGAAVMVGMCMTAGYFLTIVIVGYQDRSDALVRFGQEVQAKALAAGAKSIAVVEGKDEAMLIYCGGDTYFHRDRGLRWWNEGTVDALVIPERRIKPEDSLPAPALDSGPISKQGETRYFLFLRPQ